MEHIIVASDLSDRSEQALLRGVNLARRLGAKLSVHYVVDSAMPLAIAEDVKFQAQTALETAMQAHAKDGDLTYNISVDIGDVVDEITQAFRQINPSLLVVGVHRRRLFLDQIKETTMERLIRASRQPVLLVAGPADQEYTNALGAIDLSRACESALRHLRRIAPDAALTLFHAHEVSFLKESQRDYATWKAVASLPENIPDPIFVEASPADAVHDLMKTGKYDLLALGAHTRSNLSRLMLGGLTAGLIRNPPCDLLVAR
ncbi:universal stress protein [Yoonia sp. SDW83-1]|uniref:universal stress protein n=1 Tax=Yoonia sp. SDW83-1 TaxID=3366945 RepID=UPI00398C25C3